MAEERISPLKYESIETSKTEKEREKKTEENSKKVKRNRKENPRTVDNNKIWNICVPETPKGEDR